MVVSPEAAWKRLAQQLMTEAERIAISKGKTALTLEVRGDNVSAIGLYQRLGFNKISTLPAYYHDTSSADHMIKAALIFVEAECR